tara:strand:- start:6 stop:224 length:219 start_codon:yes stop_codon:yes gene_type:complete
MDQITFEEIISILAMHGRPDLIQEAKEHIKIDEDYIPSSFNRRDSLSISEGSAASEEDYEVEVDEKGFQSLK